MFKVPVKLALLSMLLLFLLPGTSFAAGPNLASVVAEVGVTLDQALKVYAQGKVADAKDLLNDAYFASYEAKPIEYQKIARKL